MQPLTTNRVPNEASDEVGLIIALLVRFPQIATIVSHPANGTVVLSFAVRSRLERRVERELRESVCEHVRALLTVRRESHDALTLTCESDEGLGFVRITRDVRSFSREELLLLVALLSDRFGEALVQSAPSGDEGIEEDHSVDDLIEYAIEALREPGQQRSLVGFREEKRVLVYFVASRKKAKVH
ncbi:MAG: hypothetical protein M3R44_02740 [Candidatus Eremiobacteraeota bacterium]|nr:hypothetical protein [Candidatus Eremiobacteraeota bacterium]